MIRFEQPAPPRHRRDPDPVTGESLPEAHCTDTTYPGTCRGNCPRHTPEYYADHMARHATDSI